MLELMLRHALTLSTVMMATSLAGCSSSDSHENNGGAGAGGAAAGDESSGGSLTTAAGSGSSQAGNAALGGSSAKGGSTGAAGASSSAGDAGLPSIDPSTKLSALTVEQQGQYCDWAAAQLGGYGKLNQCAGGGSVTVYKDQADCMSQAFLFSCGDKVTMSLAALSLSTRFRPRTTDRPAGGLSQSSVSLIGAVDQC